MSAQGQIMPLDVIRTVKRCSVDGFVDQRFVITQLICVDSFGFGKV